jgi:hypothetical protein
MGNKPIQNQPGYILTQFVRRAILRKLLQKAGECFLEALMQQFVPLIIWIAVLNLQRFLVFEMPGGILAQKIKGSQLLFRAVPSRAGVYQVTQHPKQVLMLQINFLVPGFQIRCPRNAMYQFSHCGSSLQRFTLSLISTIPSS